VLCDFFAQVAGRDTELAVLQAEFWLCAVRNPEATEIMAATADGQIDLLEPLTAVTMERFGAAAGISPGAVTRVVLGLFQGLMRQRRIDPAAVPDEPLAQAITWLLAGLRPAAPD
jgi:hypothetical protein